MRTPRKRNHAIMNNLMGIKVKRSEEKAGKSAAVTEKIPGLDKPAKIHLYKYWREKERKYI